MIRLEHVSKTFFTKDGIVEALRDVSLELPSKGLIALCGENGCGKTTLLNVISTFLSDYSGAVYIDNLEISHHTDYVRSELVSYVLQDDFFVNSMTLTDTLFLEKADESCVDSELARFRISDKKQKHPTELSGGQRQRASFIRGCLKDSPILLVDEPTSSMDEEMERFVFATLKEISEKKLVILVSHNLSMVKEFSDLIVHLDNGKVQLVAQNCASSDIMYSGNEILFPGELNFQAIHPQRAAQIMSEYGQIVIRRGRGKTKECSYDYEVHPHADIAVRKKMNSRQKRILLRAVRKETGKFVLVMALVLGILLVLLQGVIDLRSLDEDAFVYRTLSENGETFVSVRKEFVDDISMREVLDDFLEWETTTCSRMDVATAFINTAYLDFELDDFYTHMLYGHSRSFMSEQDMFYGKIPLGNEFAITDYVADGLIQKNPQYSSYEDIISKGIYVGEYCLPISGIVNTDYERYYNLPQEEWTNQDADNFATRQLTEYTLLYSDYRTCFSSGLYFQYLYSSDCYADILPIENTDGGCLVNPALAKQIGYDGEKEQVLKTDLDYLRVIGIREDNRVNPTVYMPRSAFDNAVRIEKSRWQFFNIRIEDKNTVSFLREQGLSVNSYTGTYVYRMVRNIQMLEKVFYVLIIIMIVLFLSLLFLVARRISKGNARIFVLQKITGYRKRDFFGIELLWVSIGSLIALLINLVSYYGGYALMNLVLSNTYGISICFMMTSLRTYVSIAAMVALSAILFESICFVLRDRKQILDLLV